MELMTNQRLHTNPSGTDSESFQVAETEALGGGAWEPPPTSLPCSLGLWAVTSTPSQILSE